MRDFHLGIRSVIAVTIAIAGLTLTPAVADVMHARVSFDSGGGMVKGAADADWSYATVNTLILPGDTVWADNGSTVELEMSGGTFLRLADGSKADVVAVAPNAHIKGWVGAFYVQRVARSTGTLVLETPVCSVDISRDSHVRVDVLSNGSTTVTVRWGRAGVTAPGGPGVTIFSGQRCYVDPGYLPSEPQVFDRNEEDAFDSWNRERARLLAQGADSVPATVRVESSTIGVSDLGSYGNWVYVDNSYYWRPTVVADYVPYRYGHWSYVNNCGYTWVGNYPFCYTTSHYGRWYRHPSYGWLWTYRETWGPAWVASVRYGSNFVWCPLDPWDRPVYFGSGGYYTVGGVNFGIFASSYCPAGSILDYGWGPVYPCVPAIVSHVPVQEIHIWNININTPGHRPGHYRDHSLDVRDYSPRRSIRGPETVSYRSESARSRASNLESAGYRSQPVAREQARSVRTAVATSARTAQLRSVSLDRDEVRDVPAIRSRSVRSGAESGAENRASTRGADGAFTPGPADTERGSVRTRTATRDISEVKPDNSRNDTSRGTSVRGGRTMAPEDAGVRTVEPGAATVRARSADPDSGADTTVTRQPTVRTSTRERTATPLSSRTREAAPETSGARSFDVPSMSSKPRERTAPQSAAPESNPSRTRVLTRQGGESSVQRIAEPTVRTAPSTRAYAVPSTRSAPSAPVPEATSRGRSYSAPAPITRSAPSVSAPVRSAPSRSYSAPAPAPRVSAPEPVTRFSAPSAPSRSPSVEAPRISAPSRSFSEAPSRSISAAPSPGPSSPRSIGGSPSRGVGGRGR